MSIPEKGQLVTANRLRDGIAALTRGAGGAEVTDDAALALEPQAAAALETCAREDERKTIDLRVLPGRCRSA